MTRLRFAFKATAGALLLVAAAVGVERDHFTFAASSDEAKADNAASPAAASNQPRLKARRVHVAPDGRLQADGVTLTPHVRRLPRSTHWIGVASVVVPDAIRAHVELPKDQGLLVVDVVPDSPAAKAGLKRHDILLTAGGKPLSQLPDLIKAVDEAKETELALAIVRQGKPETLRVTPAKQPEHAADRLRAFPTPVTEDLPGRIETLTPDGNHFTMRFFGPGMVLPKGAPMHLPLPANLQVSIVKQGGEPAKITVKRDKEQWSVTEKELDKLPEDVRPHVQRMLEGAMLVPGEIPPPDMMPGVPAPPEMRDAPDLPDMQRAIEQRMNRQFQEMDKRMERLQKMMDQFQQQQEQGHDPIQDEPGTETPGPEAK